jgi:hypothetical protein
VCELVFDWHVDDGAELLRPVSDEVGMTKELPSDENLYNGRERSVEGVKMERGGRRRTTSL